MVFESFEDQRIHYKGDFHRFNLKRKVVHLPPGMFANDETCASATILSHIYIYIFALLSVIPFTQLSVISISLYTTLSHIYLLCIIRSYLFALTVIYLTDSYLTLTFLLLLTVTKAAFDKKTETENAKALAEENGKKSNAHYCAACKKSFNSLNVYEQHVKSKVHVKVVAAQAKKAEQGVESTTATTTESEGWLFYLTFYRPSLLFLCYFFFTFTIYFIP
tara:strand:- start:845 stop:1504 length:660 start_codon:yes stop_codon:yes gene_type:complete